MREGGGGELIFSLIDFSKGPVHGIQVEWQGEFWNPHMTSEMKQLYYYYVIKKTAKICNNYPLLRTPTVEENNHVPHKPPKIEITMLAPLGYALNMQ